jgi:hypothetical protein
MARTAAQAIRIHRAGAVAIATNTSSSMIVPGKYA